MIEIEVNKYYGVPAYYSVMPQNIFDALEKAAFDGENTVFVDADQFNKMVEKYEEKIKSLENK